MQKLIIQQLDDRGKFISDEELKILLSLFSEFSRMRLMLELGAYVGLRSADIINLKVPGYSQFEGFSDDFRTLRYIVSKPNVRLNRIKHKIKERQIPPWLADKLLLYFKNNIYTFRGNRMFPICKQSIWTEIERTRKRYGERYPFLKEAYQVIIYPSGRVQNLYRIAFHTLRSRWVTQAYAATGNDIVKTAKLIGHSKIDTCQRYIRFPELHKEEREIAETKFNLSNQPKFYICKEQKRLSEFHRK